MVQEIMQSTTHWESYYDTMRSRRSRESHNDTLTLCCQVVQKSQNQQSQSRLTKAGSSRSSIKSQKKEVHCEYSVTEDMKIRQKDRTTNCCPKENAFVFDYISAAKYTQCLWQPLLIRFLHKYTSRYRNDRIVIPQKAYLTKMPISIDNLPVASKEFWQEIYLHLATFRNITKL